MNTNKITCEICGAEVHAIPLHLKEAHPEMSLREYQEKFPHAPVLSDLAKKKLEESRAAREAAAPTEPGTTIKKALFEAFSLPSGAAGVRNGRGEPIQISILSDDAEFSGMVPDVDPGYVYDVETLKNALMAIELRYPLYVWGHAGTGKTTLIEQIAARTNRPALRIQHTVNTEESHIVGQWTVRAGSTIFELGPLALAMKHGWIYLADEYDFAMPSVLAVYQPVLEGKPLVIKDADAANRVIKPHPNFRFVATGNTNGSGDETGLYQGTSIQNAANYDRFHMVLEVGYMPRELEEQVVVNQADIPIADARKLVDLATRIRQSYDGSKISSPISPRTLIASAQIGVRKGNYRSGIALAFANKLSKVDREVIDGLAARVFGA